MRRLLDAALAARAQSYAPYSGYRVGAALLAEDGRVFIGCNMENASYGATVCAERAAFAAAVTAGVRSFKAIAVAGGREEKADPAASPCGICRQVMAEFCGKDFTVVLGNEDALEQFTLEQLLPMSFQLED